jgi:GLPGLI family protein
MIYKFLIATVLVSSSAMAQVKEGKVIYERKMNLHKDMPPDDEQLKAMVPEFQTSKMELLFNSTQSLFHPLPGDDEDQMPQPGADGGRRVMRFGGMDAETFRDYDKEQIVESRELGPKKYIIEDMLKPLKWKLREDTMTIMGYLCHKATTTLAMRIGGRMFMHGADTSKASTPPPPEQQPVIAWYTEAIESPAGPENFYGLPGLILKTDFNNGSIVFTALSLESSDKTLVKAPVNGKKITRAEFRKMVDEQMRSMGGGPGGPIQTIRIVQ